MILCDMNERDNDKRRRKITFNIFQIIMHQVKLLIIDIVDQFFYPLVPIKTDGGMRRPALREKEKLFGLSVSWSHP